VSRRKRTMKLILNAAWLLACSATTAAQTITRVSVDSYGAQATGPNNLGFLTYAAHVSGDGRFVVFDSHATNLVPNDTNFANDVFVHDNLHGTTECITFGGNADSFAYGTPSEDGRFVAFWSYASNLVPGDTNGSADIFVRDRRAGTTTRIAEDASMPMMSGDGRFVSYERQVGPLTQIQVYDLRTSTAEAITNGNDDSAFAWISSNGRYVGFESYATDLVPNDTNGVRDAFLRDRWLGTTERVSIGSTGEEGNSHSDACVVSSDGRFAFFESMATNFVPGTQGAWQIYRHDRRTGLTECVSTNAAGLPCNGGTDFGPTISEDGRFLVFDDNASDLVGNSRRYWAIFLKDLALGTTIRISVDAQGTSGGGDSFWPAISRTGRYVSFVSDAQRLVPGDTNGAMDAFVWDRGY
jgi:Tol biopolymer transport system component